MKIKYMLQLSVLSAALGVCSCNNLNRYDRVNANQVGTVTEDLPATVTAVEACTIETSSSTRNLGTVIGAAVGAGSGSLLGRGKGRAVSTVGFGLVGALAGRAITDAAGNEKGQRITVTTETKPARTYTVTQPVYKNYGEIYVNQHGVLRLGGNNTSAFIPDGF
ncbi:MAG: glycine zipper 2TM domain-containing protein [Akkermansiaceae bacterium]|nr:glycine zipper 2TM domain-containing protein [Akkermansia sp.]MCD7798226.1 glycine zipper 2TM domain-containing protein [Akkermansiaceae bacterium]MCD8070051.1 glycine zipper 2TM domain-containing protein [Akkermansiaceae bacterium]